MAKSSSFQKSLRALIATGSVLTFFGGWAIFAHSNKPVAAVDPVPPASNVVPALQPLPTMPSLQSPSSDLQPLPPLQPLPSQNIGSGFSVPRLMTRGS